MASARAAIHQRKGKGELWHGTSVLLVRAGQQSLKHSGGWSVEALADALACDDAEGYEYETLEELERYETARRTLYADLAHDILIDQAYERIEQPNTCDNGGNGYYIDRDVYHQVYTS